MTADVTEGHDASTHPPSRPSRVRKTAEKPQGDEARLARMVRELYELEDDIASKLTAADRVLSQLASRRIHEDGGYTSWAEFEERMLATSPFLRAMREAAQAARPTLGQTAGAAKHDPSDARGRQTKALTAMARALERLQALDAEVHQCASAAAGKLLTIDGMRAYEECGYASFEEFLARALAPSPVLASAVALVESQPADDQGMSPPPAEPSPVVEAVREPDLPPARISEGPALFLPTEPAVPAAEQNGSEVGEQVGEDQVRAAISARRARAHIFATVLLCCAAIIAGAAAGVFSGLASRASHADVGTNEHAQSAPQRKTTP